jgi:chromosome segregation ATPase
MPAGSDLSRTLSAYSYLRPLVEGKRVLELGNAQPEGAEHLLALGARSVVVASEDAGAIERARVQHGRAGLAFVAARSPAVLRDAGPYDVIVVPEAAGLLRGRTALPVTALRGLLGSQGRLVCVVPSGDRPGADGLGYYDVVDGLSPHFARVRMFGQTPFAAYGVAEFDDATGGLRVDSALVDESAEQPISYVAIAGPDDSLALGYALVQVPVDGLAQIPVEVPVGSPVAMARQLAEAEGQRDGALRVSRAQVEEIEELRARLRRGAEDRAHLDEEVTRLRRALTEADESVVSLTRRTTEEMTALAQRLTAGLRGFEAPAPQTAKAVDESALSDRDERIATLETERQDLQWRLESAEEQLRQAASRPAVARPSAEGEELVARLRAREHALEEYRRAADTHMEEANRLRDALTEQSAAVSELEESLFGAERRAETAEKESARLRKLGTENEDADRQRRSRLAELEGTLLRLQRQAALQSERQPASDEAMARIATLDKQLDEARAEAARRRGEVEELQTRLQRQLEAFERERAEASAAAAEIALRLATLTQSEEGLRTQVGQLQERVPEPESGRLDAALAEIDRLRSELERSDEQLWEARGRLALDRQRLEALERVVAAGEGAGESSTLITDVLSELTAMESGLRAEAARLEGVQHTLDEWRTAAAKNDASEEVPPPSIGEG